MSSPELPLDIWLMIASINTKKALKEYRDTCDEGGNFGDEFWAYQKAKDFEKYLKTSR